MTDYVIPVVWPRYDITSGDQQLTGLGHAGIILVDGNTGFTRYFEYGRYDRDINGNLIGKVQTEPIPNLSIDSAGTIDRSSFESMIAHLSNVAGQGTVAQGTIIALSDGGYENALAFAEAALADPQAVLGEYSIHDNHCYTFAKSVATAGGSHLDWFDGLWVFDDVPSVAMVRLISHYGGFSLGGNTADFLIGHASRYVSEATECFAAGTMIDMWPLDPTLKPGADGHYDQKAVRAGIWRKPIEEVRATDTVVSFDTLGKLVPGHVTRTMTNDVKIILDFHGTFVTPGHVYWCAGGRFAGRYAPLIDILRDDGVIQHQDGRLIRAATGCDVGSPDDEEFWAFKLYTDDQGNERVQAKTKLRFGTRWMMPNGHHFSMRDFMEHLGVEILRDGPYRGYARWQQTGHTMPFAWVLSDSLPNPEDFVLTRSGTSLQDIYTAGQWEAVRPAMPPPRDVEGRPVQPLADSKLDLLRRNEPMAFRSDAPSSEILPGRDPKENGRQRRSAEARARQAARSRHRRSTTLH